MTHERPRRHRIALLTATALVGSALAVAGNAGTALAAPNTYRTISVTAAGSGYVLTNTIGGTYAFGSVRYHGNPAGFSGSIVGVSTTADGSGYAAISSAGQVYAYGSVQHRGNPTGFSGSIAGISTTANGSGYVAVSTTGQVYAYGSVQHRGNPTGFSGSIVGVSATADGSGYAAISNTGQVYAYGSVQHRGNPVGFSGSVVGISTTADGSGYAAISSTGQVYAYGSVTYRGNPTGFTGGIAGVSVTANGAGYAAVSGTGQVYAYGTVSYWGNGDPGSTSVSGMRATVVDKARAEAANPAHNREIGGTDCNFYSTALGVGPRCANGWIGQAWCADFAKWIWGQSGARTNGLDAGAVSFSRYSTWRSDTSFPNLAGVQPGDVVGWRFHTGDSRNDHVGVVVAVSGDTITTVDGNFSNMVKANTFNRTHAEISGYASPLT
ncbi:CHAP domain-containing protein [Asanoa ishikariensis]|uniref:CHAP domain-containing protein n=1 Tax=Asanoa ishikariensis TaxID=137265 RepID=A0A1H3TRN4_9ACTN|nr:CHAP domain-containing protein [Asanoa ishikariensis]SDZ52894.1 CHAP domain-containing protein [Asanoa ishikariensis]